MRLHSSVGAHRGRACSHAQFNGKSETAAAALRLPIFLQCRDAKLPTRLRLNTARPSQQSLPKIARKERHHERANAASSPAADAALTASQMAPYQGRVLITGFGIVAQALLPLLLRHLRLPCTRITVIEPTPRPQLRAWLDKGLRLIRERVTPSNMAKLLVKHASPGDLLVDLTWSIDFFAIAQWARDRGVLYVNASLESWDPSQELEDKPALDKSLYSRY